MVDLIEPPEQTGPGAVLIPEKPVENVVHFNPWRDFNDVPPQVDAFADEPDAQLIATFVDVVFGYCDGLIPVRSFIDKGQGFDGRPHNIWIDADTAAAEKLSTFATWAWREGAAVYIIPGTVAEQGQARAAEVLQMQTLVVDLDAGAIAAKSRHLVEHLGAPTMVIESGGRTADGETKLHVWWKLTEPASGEDLAMLCRLRGEIAHKVGGDPHFRSAHQPIRVAGSVYQKGGLERTVAIREHRSGVEVDLAEFAERVSAMPFFGFDRKEYAPDDAWSPEGDPPGNRSAPEKPSLNDVLTTPVRAGGVDEWTRFEGASAAIGHYVRLVHEGRISPNEGWEGICAYNAAMLRPPWPTERLMRESERLWAIHVGKNGLPLIRLDAHASATEALSTFKLRALLNDVSPMPDDIVAPRILTPGGLLVLGGAPKVGKSDLLISWLVHMAAGQPFLGFTPPRPLRIFYLQAEIQYHYLRERLQNLRLGTTMLQAAQDNLAATPKLKMLLDADGSMRVARAIQAEFPDEPVDIICIDPIRNLFDGGPDGGGENDNSAMMFFLMERVEVLRDHINADCGVILVHHTKKMTKQQLKDDPFLALSGASSLRGFYTSGMILHRPDEEAPERKLDIELRNGPALPAKLIDKVQGQWVELNPMNERLVRQDIGAKHDAERVRKNDVILGLLYDEARAGKIYTMTTFAEAFENKAGLGGQTGIRDRLGVLTTKGYVKFVRGAAAIGLGLAMERSKYGYLCVDGMVFGTGRERVDPETGEVSPELLSILPSHYKCAQTGAVLPVENPAVWVYHEEDMA